MTHVAFTPHPEAVELEADYVVVGSGAGGAACAVTLARLGHSVVVVEAGAWRDPADYPHSTYGAMRDLFDDWGSQVTRGRALWPVVQARTVGGTTVINSAICVRTPADIFEEWKAFGVGGDERANRVWAWQDRFESELSVSAVPDASLGRSNRLALAGAKAIGYKHHVIDRYAKDCEGKGQCLQGCKGGKKQSMNITYLPEVRRLGGTIMSSAPVNRIEFAGRRAIGVSGRMVDPNPVRRDRQRGAFFFVRAKKCVIVAASATHSPALLIRSKVKLPALGHGFRAHPGTGVFGIYNDPVDQNIGATQGWASMAFRTSHHVKLESLSLPPEMVISRLPGGGTELMKRAGDLRHLAMWVHAVRAEAVGRVGVGLFGKPTVHYEFKETDMRRLRNGIHLVAQTHFAAGARAVMPGIFGYPTELKPDQLDTILEAPLDPRAYVAILSHLFGGCVMGADPSKSVVDGQGRVHGYENLAVADASIIPSTLGVNPQHTIMAMAAMVAEDLVEQRARVAA